MNIGNEHTLMRIPSRNEKGFASLIAEIVSRDPDILLAVAEVDRSLIRLSLELPPLERVRSSAASAATLARFRRVGGRAP